MTTGETIPHWRRWVLVIWLLACIAFLAMRWGLIRHYMLIDTDDNMRMAQVRALMGGQGWYDLRQYKLNPPIGFNMHWSRLVDLPLALIQRVLRAFTDPLTAERASAAIAPLLPLGVALFAMALAVRRLVAPNAFALGAGLVLCCQTSLLMFMPQRVDHHGWQLAFLVLTVAGLADPKRMRGGATMGLASAASLVIGLELLPFLAICGAAVALRWVWEGGEATRLRGYGLSLAGGCALGYLGFASWDDAVWRCDALSPVWTWTMIAAGGGAAILSIVAADRRWVRAALAVALGALLAIGFATAFPQCLGRPEQVSPELARLWLDNVREARPLYTQSWQTILTVLSLPVIGVIGAIWAARAAWGTRRFEVWAPVALIAVVSALLLLWQTRQGPAAQLMAVPGAAALAWAVIPRLSRSTFMPVRVFGVVAAFLVISGLGIQLAIAKLPGEGISPRLAAINRANNRCPQLYALRPIAKLPATTIFTFVDLGPRLITMTHHRAVAGPYHRNGDAILDVHHAFDGTPANARATMLRHGATLLMTCPNMSESTIYRARSPDGFYSRLARHERFDWLTPVPLPRNSPLLLWRIS